MEIISIVSIITETVAIVISAFVVFFFLIQKQETPIDKNIFKMVCLTIAVLFCDILCYWYRGESSQLAYFMVRLGNFFLYLVNYLIFICYGKALYLALKPESPLQKRLLQAVYVMTYLSIGLLVVSQFTGILYSFDETNHYYRGRLYYLAQAAPICGGVIYFAIIIANRRKISKNVLLGFSVYLILPLLATVYQTFSFGYPAQTVAGVIGCWGIFLAREVEIRNQLQQALNQANRRQEELERTLELVNEQFAVLQSVAEVYCMMCLIDLDRGSAQMVRAESQNCSRENSPRDMQGIIEAVIAATAPGQQEQVREFMNLTTLSNRMGGSKTLSAEFTIEQLGWVRGQFIAVHADPGGRLTRVIFVTENINEEKRQQETLLKKSRTDGLTGLYNRGAYQDTIFQYKDEPIEDDFTLISFDLNGLKTVNDTLGHQAGDELIMGACQCMNQAFGTLGRLYRVGGDEFACLAIIPQEALQEALSRFDRLVDEWSGRLVHSLSIAYGVVRKQELPHGTIEEMAVLADQRMYGAKRVHYQKKENDRRGGRR